MKRIPTCLFRGSENVISLGAGLAGLPQLQTHDSIFRMRVLAHYYG